MQQFKFLTVESVSDQEEQAKIQRTIQNKINAYITAKTKITPEQLSDLIKKKELWVDAAGAIAYGFADKIIGKN
jgi:ATP-dependent protease ClpP protease subunit